MNWQFHIQEDVQIVCDKDKRNVLLTISFEMAVNYSYDNTDLVFDLRESLIKYLFLCRTRGRKSRKKSWIGSLIGSTAWTPLDHPIPSAGLGLAIAKEVTELQSWNDWCVQ